MAQLLYPECAGSPQTKVAVLADQTAPSTPEGLPRLDQIIAAIQTTFAMSGFLALILHALVVEVYLHLTKAESNRLKRVSRENESIGSPWSSRVHPSPGPPIQPNPPQFRQPNFPQAAQRIQDIHPKVHTAMNRTHGVTVGLEVDEPC